MRVSSCLSSCSTLGRSSSNSNDDEGGGETGSGVVGASSVFLRNLSCNNDGFLLVFGLYVPACPQKSERERQQATKPEPVHKGGGVGGRNKKEGEDETHLADEKSSLFLALRSCPLHSSSARRSPASRCVAASAIFQFSYVRESM